MIGSCLHKHLLSQNHEVIGLCRDVLDIADAKAVDDFFHLNHPDVIIHGALYGRESVRDNQIDMYQVNMQMFQNLYRNRHRFHKLINLGSGTEYDTSRDIDLVTEDQIYLVEPENYYDRVKNHISRICCDTENFCTLRMFGVMSHTESDKRFFRHLLESDRFFIKYDRFFDFVNLQDLMPVIDAVLTGQITDPHVNVVYKNKLKLSELAKMFCDITKTSYDKVVIQNASGLNYTGDSSVLDSYQIPQIGIEASMSQYISTWEIV